MKQVLLFIVIFSAGYFANYIISRSKAKVAGMDSFDLQYDRDFRNVLESIVEDKLNDRDFRNVMQSIVEKCYVYEYEISC